MNSLRLFFFSKFYIRNVTFEKKKKKRFKTIKYVLKY